MIAWLKFFCDMTHQSLSDNTARSWPSKYFYLSRSIQENVPSKWADLVHMYSMYEYTLEVNSIVELRQFITFSTKCFQDTIYIYVRLTANI